MMNRIRHYLSVYSGFINVCVAEATSYRLHFLLLIIMDLLFYGVALFSVDFIFDYVDQIGPWNREQFLFFISFMLAIDQLHMTFISESFWNLSYEIRRGMLDFVILKPISTIFTIFFRFVRPASFLNIVVTVPLLIYFGRQAGLDTVSWMLLPVFILASLALLVGLEILISTTMFWLVESYGINFLRMQFQHLSRWPDFIYFGFAQRFFTLFFPILLIGSAPVRFLLNPTDFQPLLIYSAALIVVVWAVHLFWPVALRRYESASS